MYVTLGDTVELRRRRSVSNKPLCVFNRLIEIKEVGMYMSHGSKNWINNPQTRNICLADVTAEEMAKNYHIHVCIQNLGI